MTVAPEVSKGHGSRTKSFWSVYGKLKKKKKNTFTIEKNCVEEEEGSSL